MNTFIWIYDRALPLVTAWNVARTKMGQTVILAGLVVALILTVMVNAPAASAAERPADVATATAVAPASVTPLAPAPREPVPTGQVVTLPIKGRAPMTGYNRAQFGPAWADVDRNGCDTRNDILARDMVGEVFKPRTHNCVVLTGALRDPYTGKTIKFVRGSNSRAVEVDHVVSLANAWATGAQQLSPAQRWAFANDPLNLLAVDGPTNQRKGAGDAATWLPQPSYRHDFVLRQIAVKTKYRLWTTQAEHNAMVRWAR